MVEVVHADEFWAWFKGLDATERRPVERVILRLEAAGLSLGSPHSSAIHGSRHAMRELRPQAGNSPLRVFYAFDPRRRAVVLIGGDKAADKRMYARVVPQADAIFDRYLASGGP